MIEIRLLGDFSLVYDGNAIHTLSKPRLQSLLAYLVLHRETPQFRYHLAGLLWPESPEAQALTNLRNLVFLLRQALPEEGGRLIRADAQTIQWNPDCAVTLDVWEFQRIMDQASPQNLPLENLQTAVQLYRGDLLPSCYDEWILAEREHYHQSFITLLDALIARLDSQRRYTEAIASCQRLVSFEPLHSEGYPRLVRLYTVAGDSLAALKTYRDYARLLKRELGIEPEEELQALYAHIRQAARQVPSSGESQSDRPALLPLVGRAAEWQSIRGLWKVVAGGQARMAVICGEAGIGKTRLAEEAMGWAARQGMRTAVAHCYASEGSLPYAPIVEWLRTIRLPPLDRVWQIELSRLLPELQKGSGGRPAPLTEAWQRLRLFEAITRAVVGGRSKTLLVIEDIHWADPDTLGWLHYLLRFDAHAPLLVIGTLRTEESAANPACDQLRASLQKDGAGLEIELGALNEKETAQLAANVAGKALEPGMDALLYQETEGNPLFIVETVRAELFKQVHLPGLQPLPYKARAVLENRIRQLSPAAREVVLVAATIGRAFSLDVLRQAGQAEEHELVASLDEMLQRRIVRETTQNTYDFSHDKLRQAAFTGVSGAHRQILHRQVAEALVSLTVGAPEVRNGEIAGHYEQAGNPGLALQYYRMAAESARKIFANELAIHYYQRAIELGESLSPGAAAAILPPQQMAELYEAVGDVMALVGKYPPAQAAFERALAQPFAASGIWRSSIYRKICDTLVLRSLCSEAYLVLAQAEQALNLPDEGGSLAERQEWIDIQLERSTLVYFDGDNHPDQVDPINQKIRPIIAAVGRPDQQAKLLGSEFLARLRFENYRLSEQTVSISRDYLALAEKIGNPYGITSAQFNLGFALLWYGQPQAAIELLSRVYQATTRTGDRLLHVQSLTYLSVASRKLGDLSALRPQLEELLDQSPPYFEGLYYGLALANQGWLAWREGDYVNAESLCLSAKEIWDKGGGYYWQCAGFWVLLAVVVSRHDLSQSEKYARVLLDPNPIFQPLEKSISARLNEALRACQAQDAEAAFQLFSQALEMAKANRDL